MNAASRRRGTGTISRTTLKTMSALYFARLALLPALLLPVSLGAQHEQHQPNDQQPVAPQEEVRILDGLGTHSMSISTSVPMAQRFFNQGLRLAYAFNHEEAGRSFAHAAQLDPS